MVFNIKSITEQKNIEREAHIIGGQPCKYVESQSWKDSGVNFEGWVPLDSYQN